jgi:hypothetical protein
MVWDHHDQSVVRTTTGTPVPRSQRPWSSGACPAPTADLLALTAYVAYLGQLGHEPTGVDQRLSHDNIFHEGLVADDHSASGVLLCQGTIQCPPRMSSRSLSSLASRHAWSRCG